MSWQGANAAQNGRAFGARRLIAHSPPRNTPFPPSDSLGLSPSVSAGLEKGGIPSRKRRGEVCGGRGSQFPPAEPISARRSAGTGWIGRRKTLSATPPPSTALFTLSSQLFLWFPGTYNLIPASDKFINRSIYEIRSFFDVFIAEFRSISM